MDTGEIIFRYRTKDIRDKNSKEITIRLNEDINLTTLFGHFIDFTRLIGYQEGSWDNVINDFIKDAANGDYRAFDWSLETIY